jgi:hypothetical protein
VIKNDNYNLIFQGKRISNGIFRVIDPGGSDQNQNYPENKEYFFFHQTKLIYTKPINPILTTLFRK